MWLESYGASTSAGPTAQHFWKNLIGGKTAPMPVDPVLLKQRTTPLPDYRVHWRKDISQDLTHRERLSLMLDEAWSDLLSRTDTSVFKGRIGVLFASTKGFTDDAVWSTDTTYTDTLTPLLTDFIKRHNLDPVDRGIISSACASVAVALTVADQWLQLDRADTVFVISSDAVGEFVLRGFHSLQALTQNENAQPFDENRTGLQLGEAAAILCVSSTFKNGSLQMFAAVNCEGVAATRPDDKGRSLYLALETVTQNKEKPTLVIAHGTGTVINDATEDLVFGALYGETPPLVTATKWCVGHTLGVSCGLDIIAGAMCIEKQKVFSLPFSKNIASHFHARYVTYSAPEWRGTSVLVSSLGFGGVHAGVYLREVRP